jgi:AcrR family transcriptional regulator
MAPKRKNPRKLPVQARSKIKVEAILEAAAHILKRDGPAGFTTNHVAEAANVSVGSIYQYFPNKESILVTLMRRQITRARAMRPAVLDQKDAISLCERIQAAVRWHLDVRREDPEIHRRLYEVHRDVLTSDERAEFDRFHETAVLSALSYHRREIHQRNLATAALVVSQFMLAATQAATAERPELLRDPDYERSIARAVLAYLKGG